MLNFGRKCSLPVESFWHFYFISTEKDLSPHWPQLLLLLTNLFSILWAAIIYSLSTVKTCVNGHIQKDQKMVFKTDYCLMQVKSIAECSKGSILQYFRPLLSYHLSIIPLFCLFLSGHFTQVLLYIFKCWNLKVTLTATGLGSISSKFNSQCLHFFSLGGSNI